MKSAFALVTFILLLQNFAQAGPRVGNGGGTWICAETTTHAIRWIQLVDLFEAKNEYGYPMCSSYESASEWDTYLFMKEKLERLIPESELHSLEPAEQLESRIQMLGAKSALTEIDDAFIRVRPDPDSCLKGYLYYGQIANFTQDGRLLIDQNKWSLPFFSNSQKAALLIHEAIYKTLRDQFHEQTSLRARKMVGILFSNLPETTQQILLQAVLSTPVTIPTDRPSTSCHAEVLDTQGLMIEKRDFEILGGIDRATISIAPFEFSVDVDGQTLQPIRIRISESAPHEHSEKAEFATQRPSGSNSAYTLRLISVDGTSAVISCRMPN